MLASFPYVPIADNGWCLYSGGRSGCASSALISRMRAASRHERKEDKKVKCGIRKGVSALTASPFGPIIPG